MILTFIWAAFKILSSGITTIAFTAVPEITLVLLWKEIIIFIFLFICFLGKEVKESCDTELFINENAIKIVYKDVQLNYENYPKYVIIEKSYPIKNIQKIVPKEGKIKIVGKQIEKARDYNNKVLHKKTYKKDEEFIFEVPTEYIMEAFKDIQDMIKLSKTEN